MYIGSFSEGSKCFRKCKLLPENLPYVNTSMTHERGIFFSVFLFIYLAAPWLLPDFSLVVDHGLVAYQHVGR